MIFKKFIHWIKEKHRFKQFENEHGFHPYEIWNLNTAIAKYILPRLKAFKKTYSGYPLGLTEEKWDDMIDDMIFAFEYEVNQWDLEEPFNKKELKRIEKGFKYFGKYFLSLWY